MKKDKNSFKDCSEYFAILAPTGLTNIRHSPPLLGFHSISTIVIYFFASKVNAFQMIPWGTIIYTDYFLGRGVTKTDMVSIFSPYVSIGKS